MRSIILTAILSCGIVLSSSAQLSLTAVSQSVECTETNFCIDIEARNFTDVLGMEWALFWDPNNFGLRVADLEWNLNPPPTANIDQVNGFYSVSWFGPFTGTSVANDSVIATLCFDQFATAVAPFDFTFGANPGGSEEIITTAGRLDPSQYDLNAATITITDMVMPNITCPADTVLPSGISTVGNIGPGSFSDNCGVDTVYYTLSGATSGSGANDASGTTFNDGVSTVTYTVEDRGGNINTCSFTVTIDNPTPVNPNIVFFDPQIEINCATNSVTLSMEVINWDSIIGFQTGIEWDTSLVEYTGNTNIALPGASFIDVLSAQGQLVVTWTQAPPTPDGYSLPDGSVIFEMTFNLKQNFTLPLIDFVTVGAIFPQVSKTGGRLPIFQLLNGDLTILDPDPPVLTNCPADVTLAADANQCGTNFSWTIPTATDVCDSSPTLISNKIGNSDFFGLGTDTIFYIARDDAGNADTCLFTVTVADSTAPVITCPADVVVSSDPGGCTAVVNGLAPSTTSNCPDTVSYTLTGATAGSGGDDASGTTFEIGVTTVTYIITEGSLADTCSFTVTVNDDTDPAITCPADITMNNDAGVCGAVINGIAPVSTTSNCPSTVSFLLTGATGGGGLNDASGRTFNVGTTTVTYTIREGTRSASCSFTVTVLDAEAPSINCSGPINANTDPGLCEANISIPVPTISDNCAIDTVFNDFTNGLNASGTYPLGTTTVNYTIIDVNGNQNTCSFDVTVVDNQGPSLSCPGNQIIVIQSGTDTIVNGIDPMVLDNCMVPTVSYTLSDGRMGSNTASGLSFPVGSTTVEYTVPDGNGGTITCSFTVTVQLAITDIISCPPDIIDTTGSTSCGVVINNLDPNIFINPAQVDTLYYSLTGATVDNGVNDASGTSFNTGLTVLTYIARDVFGNRDTCTTMITVRDTTPPIWNNCPDTITVQAGLGCTATATWSSPVASDNCMIMSLDSSHASGAVFGLGMTQVVYRATDQDGNVGTCNFFVSVVDSTAPVFGSCGANNLSFTYVDDCRAVVNWDPIVAGDACGSVSLTQTHLPGDTFDVNIPTNVIIVATDNSGNMAECSFSVNIPDTIAPVVATCLPDTIIMTGTNTCGADYEWTNPDFTDNCTSNVTVQSSIASGSTFDVGTTRVVIIGTDESGNVDSCSFNVTVVDASVPVFDCDSIVVSLDGTIVYDGSNLIVDAEVDNQCQGVKLSYNNPSATDACDTVAITQTDMTGLTNGSTFPPGRTTLEFTADDGNGNTATCSFVINVIDIEALNVAVLPNNAPCAGENISLQSSLLAGATYAWSGPGFSGVGQTVQIANIGVDNAGTYTVTATLPSGCTSVGTAEVTVEPTPNVSISSNAPVCTGPVRIEAVVQGPPIVVSWDWTFPNGETDDSQNPVIPNPSEVYNGNYILVATGTNGCEFRDTVNLSVNNLEAPSLTSNCNEAICIGNSCTLIGTEYLNPPDSYNWFAVPEEIAGFPASTDDNSIVVTPAEVGDITYSYFVVDGDCVSDTVSITVSVIDEPMTQADSVSTTRNTPLVFDVLLNDGVPSGLNFTVETIGEETLNGVLVNNGDGTFRFEPNTDYINRADNPDQFQYRLCYSCQGEQICSEFNTVSIYIRFDGPCQVPNVITPNEDGENDSVLIDCLDVLQTNTSSMLIFNQWGSEVYRAEPYDNNNPWDGSYKGEPLPDGTYFYIFRSSDTAEEDKGAITILR